MTLIAHPPRREYSFTSAQISNPAAPPPGDKLDGEVDRIHRALENIIDWVSVSLNSDGTLKPQVAATSGQPPVTITGADITALAEDWAFASADWAEHMPDTIPPNTLNIMTVTGDHWSARWWANRALEIVNAAGDSVFAVISDTPPAPGLGKFWWDSVGGQLYLYYDDGNSAQWVPATNQPGPPGPPGPPGTGLSAPVQVAEGGTGVVSFPAPSGAAYLLGNGTAPVAASAFWYASAAEPYSIIGRTSVAEGWCPYIQMASSGGTMAAPAATPAGTPLGGIFAEGHDGTGWTNGAANLTFYASADFTAGAQPTYADLWTSGGDFIFGPTGDLTVPGTAILGTPLPVASGGTGAATAAAARTNLGAAPLVSPVFTGNPTAPTPTPGDSDTSIATTAFVAASFAPLAPLASPNLTGNPTAPTPAPGDSDTSIATTAFVTASFAPLANPHLTGIPTAPTPSPGNSTTQLATTAFVAASIGASGGGTITGVTAGAGLSGGGTTGTVALALSSPVAIANGGTNATTAPAALANLGAAPLASPALTGNPTAPTPSPGDNDTSIATSAFVTAAITAAPNKTITLTGDVTGSGTAGIAATLASVNPNVGTFQGITVNAKGLVTGAGNQNYAPLASPNLTGNPTAPTPSPGDNDTSIATTAFVTAAAAAYLPLAGVTNASNAAPGAIGEVIQAELTFATSLALTTAVWRNVVSITLTPGDWDVFGTIGFYSDTGTTTISRQSGAISLTSGTADGPGPLGGGYFDLAANATPGGGGDFPVGRRRVNVATSTTVYLIGYAAFAVSTLWVYGGLYARRMR